MIDVLGPEKRRRLEMVFVWKQNYILVDEYFFFCCTWIVNSADIRIFLSFYS